MPTTKILKVFYKDKSAFGGERPVEASAGSMGGAWVRFETQNDDGTKTITEVKHSWKWWKKSKWWNQIQTFFGTSPSVGRRIRGWARNRPYSKKEKEQIEEGTEPGTAPPEEKGEDKDKEKKPPGAGGQGPSAPKPKKYDPDLKIKNPAMKESYEKWKRERPDLFKQLKKIRMVLFGGSSVAGERGRQQL